MTVVASSRKVSCLSCCNKQDYGACNALHNAIDGIHAAQHSLHNPGESSQCVLKTLLQKWLWCAAEGVDAGPDEGGALGADSDEEEKRANRAKAANADQSSMVEARNQNNNADVGSIPMYLAICMSNCTARNLDSKVQRDTNMFCASGMALQDLAHIRPA